MPSNQKLLVWLCFLCYTISYVGRYAYSANINPIIKDYKISRAAAGLAPSFFFFAYGLGQITHGLLCKKYPRKYVLPFCIFLSASINFSIFLGLPFVLIKYVWFLNGFILATLWPSLILTISRNIEKRHLQKAILAMSSSVAVGTFISYGFSAIFVSIGFYKMIFIFSAILMLIMAAVWFFSFDKLTTEQKEEPVLQPLSTETQRRKIDPSVLAIIVSLAFMAVCVNVVRDGLHTWVPTILKDVYGLEDSLSILLSIVLPVFGVFSATVSLLVRKKISNFVMAAGALFMVSALCVTASLFVLDISVCVPLLLLFCILLVLTGAVNNIITSVAPLFMRDKVNSGLVAGTLNGCCYLGSTISSYGLGGLADKAGWNAVFYLFIGVCLLSACIAFVYLLLTRKKKSAN